MSQVQPKQKRKKELRLLHFYPDLLNLYGDYGNVLAIKRRAEWRGFEVTLDSINLDTYLDLDIKNYDIAFIGGGQDRQQLRVADDFLARQEKIAEAVNDGLVILAICGGYQLLGKLYENSEGEQIPGLGILDVETYAQGRKSLEKQKRLIGNLSAKLKNSLLIQEFLRKHLEPKVFNNSIYSFDTLVGFENHSGETFIVAAPGSKASDSATEELTDVIYGNGNNLKDNCEGVLYKNIFGTYLHGSLLPKNPHLVDELIFRALDRRNEQLKAEEWLSLDDSFEVQAHKKALSLR